MQESTRSCARKSPFCSSTTCKKFAKIHRPEPLKKLCARQRARVCDRLLFFLPIDAASHKPCDDRRCSRVAPRSELFFLCPTATSGRPVVVVGGADPRVYIISRNAAAGFSLVRAFERCGSIGTGLFSLPPCSTAWGPIKELGCWIR